VAAAIQEPQDGVTIVGDFQFLMEKTNGSSSWKTFVSTLARYNDGTIRVVYLPDSDDCPPTLDVALDVAKAAGFVQVPTETLESHYPSYVPPYGLFRGFEAVGPLLLEFFSDEFEEWMRNSDQSRRWQEFNQDVQALRKIFDETKADDGEWSSYLEMWDGDWLYGLPHVSLSFEDRYLGTRNPGSSYLVELAEGDWVELIGVSSANDGLPKSVKFHHLDLEDLEADVDFVANWIESHQAGYAAAIKLLIDPMMYMVDGEDELADAFQFVAEGCLCNLDAFAHRDERLSDALARTSTQFAEFEEIIEGPKDEQYELLLELAEAEHVGFGGQMGLFADWSTK
jgi:hypothetical protein